MKEYTTESIRNVAVVSHGSAGKTMLTEAFLHTSGGTTRLGKIEDGTTLSDYDEEEIRRGISIYTSVIPVEYKNTKINFLDTPGYNDFVGEVISALRVSDAALILVDSVAGLEVGTEIAWNYCNHFNLPRFLVINKLERDNASFAKAVASVQEFTDIRLIPVQLPWGEKAAFQGVIDLITMKAFKGDGKTIVDIPADLRPAAEEAHLKLVEAAAEGDDSLMEKYFESGELTIEEILKGLKSGIQSLSFVPVFVTSGAAEIGIIPLLDAIVSLFPSPSETAPAVAQGKDGEEKFLHPIQVPWLCMFGKPPPIPLLASKPSSGCILVWSHPTAEFGTRPNPLRSGLAPSASHAERNSSLPRPFIVVILQLFPNYLKPPRETPSAIKPIR